jgi:3-oxoacyl-[acyl-carrier-protein] synthase II
VVPPTINLENPDLEAGCDLDYVPNVAYKYPDGQGPRAIVSDNLGFGKYNKLLLSLTYILFSYFENIFISIFLFFLSL